MIDTGFQRPIKVTEYPGGAVIYLSLDVREQVRKFLEANGIRYWVKHTQITLPGQPTETSLHLGLKEDPRRVQQLLDAA
jgi:hypothetical protein